MGLSESIRKGSYSVKAGKIDSSHVSALLHVAPGLAQRYQRIFFGTVASSMPPTLPPVLLGANECSPLTSEGEADYSASKALLRSVNDEQKREA
jgi:hypothetical protein